MFKKVFILLALVTCAGFVQAQNPKVTMETNQGTVVIELYPEQAPITVENFLAYVNDGFYNGTIFHRIIPNFMVQGGGYTEVFYEDQNKEKTTRAPIKNEADNGLANEVGTIAMARTQDPHSASSQFFINVKDNAFLNHTSKDVRGWGYCVFGKVVKGLDVVLAMSKVQTRNLGPTPDVPAEPVVITKMSVQ